MDLPWDTSIPPHPVANMLAISLEGIPMVSHPGAQVQSHAVLSRARALTVNQRAGEHVYNADAFTTLVSRLWEQTEEFVRRYTVPGRIVLPGLRGDS